MATEYRVKWKRKGLNPKRIRYTSMKAAERRLALLTSAEPAYTRQPIASDTPARNWRARRQKARVIAEHIGGDEAEAKSWQSIK